MKSDFASFACFHRCNYPPAQHVVFLCSNCWMEVNKGFYVFRKCGQSHILLFGVIKKTTWHLLRRFSELASGCQGLMLYTDQGKYRKWWRWVKTQQHWYFLLIILHFNHGPQTEIVKIRTSNVVMETQVSNTCEAFTYHHIKRVQVQRKHLLPASSFLNYWWVTTVFSKLSSHQQNQACTIILMKVCWNHFCTVTV